MSINDVPGNMSINDVPGNMSINDVPGNMSINVRNKSNKQFRMKYIFICRACNRQLNVH
jgi:hypothetical protein